MDELDVAIVGALMAENGLTTTSIARMLSEAGSPVHKLVPNVDTREGVQKMDNRVRYRLKNMERDGVVSAENGIGPKKYKIDETSVFSGNGVIKIFQDTGDDHTFDMGRIIAVRQPSGRFFLIPNSLASEEFPSGKIVGNCPVCHKPVDYESGEAEQCYEFDIEGESVYLHPKCHEKIHDGASSDEMS